MRSVHIYYGNVVLIIPIPVMIGDVNLFFNDPDNDKSFAEIEIMIAEEKFRRCGYGIEAIKIMMAYGK